MKPSPGKLAALFGRICRENDQAAFTELFRTEYKRLFRFALQFVSSQETAEEAVNDVFIKLWSYRTSLDKISHPESYLFIAVRNQCLNYIRKYSHIHIAVDEESNRSQLVVCQDPQQDMEWKELQFRLSQVVDQLPDQCRKIFRLVKEEGFKPKEVAEILHISQRTVETQVYRAMKRINQFLDDASVKNQSFKSRMGRYLPGGFIIPVFYFLFL